MEKETRIQGEGKKDCLYFKVKGEYSVLCHRTLSKEPIETPNSECTKDCRYYIPTDRRTYR